MNKKPRILIFSTVWPEPQSSAAGVRLLQWISLFRSWDYAVVLSSPSQLKEPQEWGYFAPPEQVSLLPLQLNDSSSKEKIAAVDPEIVLFDRFILEEQFGHLVYEACPQALILLETQDLHFVRRAREQVKEKWLEMTGKELPEAFYHTETAVRETASIYRCDLTFVVSAFEANLLQTEFGLGSECVKWVPFFYDSPVVESSSAWGSDAFEDRNGFCFIGNFRHAPNVDALKWLKKEIWPEIRAMIPGVKIEIWGAYPSSEGMQLHDPFSGFLVKGHANSLEEVFEASSAGSKPRVSLAPLRFGAGVKGKVLESMRYGVPVVGTSVAGEGLVETEIGKIPQFGEANFLGNNRGAEFAKCAVRVHQQKEDWKKAQIAGKNLLENHYSWSTISAGIKAEIDQRQEAKRAGRLPRWISKIGRHELFNSHRYFSKWIELKERK